MSHTPAPWSWNCDELVAGDISVMVLGDDGACGDPECCGAPSYRLEVSDDDKRLIAAAPELLAALKPLMD